MKEHHAGIRGYIALKQVWKANETGRYLQVPLSFCCYLTLITFSFAEVFVEGERLKQIVRNCECNYLGSRTVAKNISYAEGLKCVQGKPMPEKTVIGQKIAKSCVYLLGT